MKLRTIVLALLTGPLLAIGQDNANTNAQYQEDFAFFWKAINDEYAYFHHKQTDWQKVKALYGPQVAKVTNREQFVSLLEKALYELYDHHAILNTNTDSSFRLVPSGTDTWAAYVNGKPAITEVRKGFGTAACGIRAGMIVVAINDVPVERAVAARLPQSLTSADTEANNFVLRQLLAGNHLQARKLTLSYNGKTADYYPDNNSRLLEHIQHDSTITAKMMGNTGYIRINDCLYNTSLAQDFDSVMETMRNTASLIIDLRDTPSGGNTVVAKAILSWFITREHFYQRHEYYAEEKAFGIKHVWEEIVSPRKGKYYSKPLAILCDHWTASLGEAIVIGFDALKRPHTIIIGTAMARLNGAVYTEEMPNTKIHFSFPAERLYHVNGLPRENYIPQQVINTMPDAFYKDNDPFIAAALRYLQSR